MSRVAYIGVDAGTSACKTVIVDDRRRLLHTAWAPYPTQRGSAGEVTQDARHWLDAAARTIRECVEAAHDREVCAIGVTAPAHNVVLVGANAEPLQPVILWSDARCAEVAAELSDSIGAELRARALVELGPGWTLPQLAWLGREHPQSWSSVRRLLVGKDYLRFRMTGEALTDPSDAAGTAMYDQRTGSWMDDAIAVAGVPPGLLPPILPSTAQGGGLSQSWARRTGLRTGTPVAVGATDTAAELVAADAVEDGSSLVKIASTGTVVVVAGEPRPEPGLFTYPHAVADRWYMLAATNTAATAYGWLRGALFESTPRDPGELYRVMDEIASGVEAGAEGLLFLPFLDGERSPHSDPQLRAAFIGLSARHARAHLCRAVLEGVALSLHRCSEFLADAGLDVHCPALAGGGTASRIWLEILTAALGQPGRLQQPQGPALGAALLAAASTGAPIPTGARGEVIPCREDWREVYERLYPIYRRATSAVAEISHELVDHHSPPATVGAAS